jgi:hypothetical protein
MKIECTLRRKGGTFVEMPGKTYHFAPTPEDERHIADVANDAHIERFLAIPESFRIARSPGAEAVETDATALLRGTVPPIDTAPTETQPDPSLLKVAGSMFPPSFEINGKTYSLMDVTMRAFMDSGLTVEDWNGLDDEHRATKTEIVLEALEDGEITLEPSAPAAGPVDERAALVAAYTAKFGKAPAANIKTETLKAKLAEAAE